MNKTQKGRERHYQGHWAETLARIFLNLKGYSCLAQNYQGHRGTEVGEVDLIMRRGKVLVFVEVKKRQDIITAAYAIQPKQQKRIIKAAEAFLQVNPRFQDFDIRFDAVLVKFPISVRHIKNAWQAF